MRAGRHPTDDDKSDLGLVKRVKKAQRVVTLVELTHDEAAPTSPGYLAGVPRRYRFVQRVNEARLRTQAGDTLGWREREHLANRRSIDALSKPWRQLEIESAHLQEPLQCLVTRINRSRLDACHGGLWDVRSCRERALRETRPTAGLPEKPRGVHE